MILLLATFCFAVLLFALRYLLRDFAIFLWRKTSTFTFPSSFVDFGEFAVTIIFTAGLSVLGVLFSKFGTAFFAYIFSSDLVSFFISLRGVFTMGNDLQNPLSWQHIILLMLTPAIQFVTFYFLYRGIRTFMFTVNNVYGRTYSESDVLYFGFLSSIMFIFIEIIFFSQNIPVISEIAHFSYLALSKLSAIGYYLAVAHIQLLRNEQYKTNLPTYLHLKRIKSKVIFSPPLICLITYLLGLVLHVPFYTGTQFMENNNALFFILVGFSAIFFFVLKFFLSGGFNYLGVVMWAESPAELNSNVKIFDAKTGKMILYSIIAVALLFAILKLKFFFTVIFLFAIAIMIYSIFYVLLYLIGLGASLIRIWIRKIEPGEITKTAIWKYLLTTFNASAKAAVPMFGFILFVFALFSFFPKNFDYQNENYVHSVFDKEGNPLYIEDIDGNGCVPVSEIQIPGFFFKCLYAQEDRCFANQHNFFPANFPKTSNWHGISLAVFYRFFYGGGGSNLNMQLIKNAANVISQDVQRKFVESLSAYQLSLQATDTTIITTYLNEVSMTGGKNQSGVMQGSLYTFGLPINELNPLEIMYLVATLPRSSTFKTQNDTFKYIDAESHKEDIAEELLRRAKLWESQGLITKREYNSLRNQELRFTNTPFKTICETTTNQFFLKQMQDSEIKGLTYESCITLQLQQDILDALTSFEDQFHDMKTKDGCNLYSAAIVVDVNSGKVIGHYGGDGITDLTQFSNGNPIGSIIKPFLFLEMLEEGFDFDNIHIFDGKIEGMQTPNNYSGSYSNHFVDINEILSKSLNAPAVNLRQLTEPIPLFKSIEGKFAEMGIKEDYYLNLDDADRRGEYEINYPLGQSRHMTLFDIAQAYQTLLNNGSYRQLTALNSVYDPIENETNFYSPVQKQIYSEENAEAISIALTHSLEVGGTAHHLKKLLPANKTFYAKTGTTDGYRHGYTVLSDGNILIITYVTYGKVVNDQLSLGLAPIPFLSGGRSAGILAALIYNEIESE